ncbi:MAG: GNAT family N-acetyltransferase, partial [Acholeplasmataceae bacterium]|nr:GNAT family N-acetyltransferase [Acholeplasmataceae bacterium]
MISKVRIRKANATDLKALTQLALALWPDNDADELETEMQGIIEADDAVIFLTTLEDEALGFAQCQLRWDYVEGTSTSPVGYLEGIYILEGWRSQGLGSKLLASCEDWARDRGCQEFASDCELDNHLSFLFHKHTGFEEANRVICFTK